MKKMKKQSYYTLVALIIVTFLNAQENTNNPKKYMGYLEFGGGISYTAKSNKMYHTNVSYNSLIKEKYVIGLNFIYAFEPSFTGREFPNHVNNYTLPNINFGIRNKVGKIYLTPTIGIGQANYRITDYSSEDVANIGLTTTSLDISSSKKYKIYTDKQIAVPINLNILLTGKYAGVALNFYMIASKYSEIGTGISFCLGKVK